MKFIAVEKQILKIDKDIDGLNRAKKYLSNGEEIEEVKVELNRKRQALVLELYKEDVIAHEECYEAIEPLFGQALGKEEQGELLEEIKEIFGRRVPEISKASNGLNAWLNKLQAEYEWSEDEEWAMLTITHMDPII